MTTLNTKGLEALRDEYCCECGHVVAERAGGLAAVRIGNTVAVIHQPEHDKEEAEAMEYLHDAGLQEEYLL